jgi:hypothetical protein
MIRVGSFAAIDLVKVLGLPMDLVRTRAVTSTGAVTGLLVGAIAAGPYGAVVGTVVGNLLVTTVWGRRAWIVGDRPAPQVANTAT